MSGATERQERDVFHILTDKKFNMMRMCITTDIDLYPHALFNTDECDIDSHRRGEGNAELGRDTKRDKENRTHD